MRDEALGPPDGRSEARMLDRRVLRVLRGHAHRRGQQNHRAVTRARRQLGRHDGGPWLECQVSTSRAVSVSSRLTRALDQPGLCRSIPSRSVTRGGGGGALRERLQSPAPTFASVGLRTT